MASEQHNRLAELALRWLENKATGRGLRGGFEVPIAEGYVADAVALCCFQERFARQYVGKGIVHLDDYTLVVPEVACIFEAKATRSDFLATFSAGEHHKNRKYPVGSLHWCVAARNAVKTADELPAFWGLLTPRGTGLTEVRAPLFCQQSEATLHKLAYQVLWYAKNHQRRWNSAVYRSLDH